MNTIAILHILFFKYVSCKFASLSYFANMIFLLGRNQNTISSGFKAPPSSVSLLDGDIYIYTYFFFTCSWNKQTFQTALWKMCAQFSGHPAGGFFESRGEFWQGTKTSHASACLGTGLGLSGSDPLVFQQKIQLLSPPSWVVSNCECKISGEPTLFIDQTSNHQTWHQRTQIREPDPLNQSKSYILNSQLVTNCIHHPNYQRRLQPDGNDVRLWHWPTTFQETVYHFLEFQFATEILGCH